MNRSAYVLNSLAAFIGAIVAALAVVSVVGDAAVELWSDDRFILAAAAVIGFPLTFVVWPWTHAVFGFPLWPVFIAGVIGFSIGKYWAEHEGNARESIVD